MIERLAWIYAMALLCAFITTGNIAEFCGGMLLGVVLAMGLAKKNGR